MSFQSPLSGTPGKKKDKKEIARELVALQARVSELELRNESNENDLRKVNSDLSKAVQERDRLVVENKRLKAKVRKWLSHNSEAAQTDELQNQLDRYVSRKWNHFVSNH